MLEKTTYPQNISAMKRITNNERLRVAVLLGFIFFTTVFLPGFTKIY